MAKKSAAKPTKETPGCNAKSSSEKEKQRKMPSFSVINAVNLKEITRVGIKQVKILASGLPDICPICRLENGKIYPFEAAPILPHENCTCERGCSCLLIANDPGLEEEVLPISL
jgi:hypothetical protein